MDELFGGTYCPECGKKQGHFHLGWLNDHVLLTQVNCPYCSVTTLMIRVFNRKNKKVSHEVWGELQREIEEIFRKQKPRRRLLNK